MNAAQIAGALTAIGLILDIFHVKNQSILANRFLDWWDKLHRIKLQEATFASSKAISRFVDALASPKILSFRSITVGCVSSVLVTYLLCRYYGQLKIIEMTYAGPFRVCLLASAVFYLPGVFSYLLTRFFIRRLSRTSNLAVVALVFAVNYLIARLVAAFTLGIYFGISTGPLMHAALEHRGRAGHLPEATLLALARHVLTGTALARQVFIPSATAPLVVHLLIAGFFLLAYVVAQGLKGVDRLMEGIIHKLNDNIFTLVGGSLGAACLLTSLVYTYTPVSWAARSINQGLAKVEEFIYVRVGASVLMHTEVSAFLRSHPAQGARSPGASPSASRPPGYAAPPEPRSRAFACSDGPPVTCRYLVNSTHAVTTGFPLP